MGLFRLGQAVLRPFRFERNRCEKALIRLQNRFAPLDGGRFQEGTSIDRAAGPEGPDYMREVPAGMGSGSCEFQM